MCKLRSDSVVADIGCGAAGTLEYLDRAGIHHLVGLDCSEELLKEAVSRLAPGRFVRGRAEILPFRKSSLDAVFCECVLSATSDRMTVLNECSQVLKEEGFLIISDLFRQENRDDEEETGSKGFRPEGFLTKKGIFAILEGFGLSVFLWEEYKEFLKEFVARMILSGEDLPDVWDYRKKQGREKTDCREISYFLMIGRKTGFPLSPAGNMGASYDG
jgi:ubiquinone/menaquinone biosynthesis C-methylase UbiE